MTEIEEARGARLTRCPICDINWRLCPPARVDARQPAGGFGPAGRVLTEIDHDPNLFGRISSERRAVIQDLRGRLNEEPQT